MWVLRVKTHFCGSEYKLAGARIRTLRFSSNSYTCRLGSKIVSSRKTDPCWNKTVSVGSSTNAEINYFISHVTTCETRGSAIAEEPRDALRQLKYYGRFFIELLTRSSANPEEPCEHNVSWNRVKCCTNVRRIPCENVCNRWMTFKVIQGHCRCCHLIGDIIFPISLPL